MNEVFSQIVVGVPTGLGAAWLAHFKFQAQRRWERKEDAYKEVLEALHEMRRSNEVFYDADLERRELPEERVAALHRRWRNGQLIVYRYADIGSVILSPVAEKILADLRTKLEAHFDSWFDQLDSHAYDLRIAMDALKQAALADRRQFVWWRFKAPKWLSPN